MKWLLIVVGVLLMLSGAVFFLQGINVLLGSPMTGQPQWTVRGALAVVIGAGLLVAGLRRNRA